MSITETLKSNERVAPAEVAGVEEHAQYLYVMLGRNAGDDDAHDEKADPAQQ